MLVLGYSNRFLSCVKSIEDITTADADEVTSSTEEEEEENIDMNKENRNVEEPVENSSSGEDTDEENKNVASDPCSLCVELSQHLINIATKNNININSPKHTLTDILHTCHSIFGSQLTTLHFACLMNNSQLVKLCVEDGADVNAQTAGLHSPMHMLLSRPDDPNIVNYLICHGANLELRNSKAETPLHIAARASSATHRSVFKNLHSVNASAACNVTPQMIADSAISIEIIDLLLASGSDPCAKACFGQLPVHSSMENVNVFKHLLEKTDLAAINQTESMKSLLDYILWEKATNNLEILLNSNCCKELCLEEVCWFVYGWQFYSKYTKMCWIGYLFNKETRLIHSFQSWKKMLDLMLKYGLSINSKSPEFIPPLCLATYIASTTSIYNLLNLEFMHIRELIHCGADVNCPDALAPEALLYSCRCRNPNVMLLLLQHSDYATPDSVINGYKKVDKVSKIAPEVIELFLRLGMTQSSMKLLSSHKTAVSDYCDLTGYICTLEQLSRIAVRH